MKTVEIEVLDVVTRTTDLLYKVLSECKPEGLWISIFCFDDDKATCGILSIGRFSPLNAISAGVENIFSLMEAKSVPRELTATAIQKKLAEEMIKTLTSGTRTEGMKK